ncbi:MAG TPA: hypothetical protein VHT28_05915 [Silvibacterium sp.]|nr:hypothetical protein [Silvibacterium sp.]
MDPSKSPFDDPDFPGKSESATSDPSSATAIFGTVSARPAPPQEDDLLRSLLKEESTPAPAGAPQAIASPASQTPPWTPAAQSAASPVATQPPSSSSPGEFTDMFQALATPASSSTPGVTPGANPGAAPTPPPPASPTLQKPLPDLANVFTQVLVQKSFSHDAPPPPASAKPGEFTQLLQTLSTPVEKGASEIPPPAAPETAKAAASPSSFTQMLNAISASPGEPTGPSESARPAADLEATKAIPIPPQVAPLSSQPMKQEAAAAPGDFTRIFQSPQPPRETGSPQPLPPPVPPQSAAASGPGAFTQMFSQRPMEKTPQEDPLKSLKPESMPASSFEFSGSPARSPEAMPPAQGGFTQLLQALNKEEPAAAKPAETFMPPPPPQPAATGPAAGGFTQLLQTLSADPAPPRPAAQPPFAQSFSPPPLQTSPAPPPSSTGPGEFTRIISGSALRELQGQGAAQVPPAATPGSRPGMAPMQFPQPPAFPQAPPMPQMPAHAAAPPPAMPHFQPAAFPFPQPPAPPPAPAPAPGKLQQYLPLILILNIFVLLVIVLILFFVLRHK